MKVRDRDLLLGLHMQKSYFRKFIRKINIIYTYKMSFGLEIFFNLFVSTIICAFSILGGELDYPGNDDTFRNLISVGAFGNKYNYYLPYSNVLYGVPIMILNRILPAINWYYWVMIGISVISISFVCTIVFEDLAFPLSSFGCVMVNILLSRDYYVAVQFTKAASLWFICGAIIIIVSIAKNKRLWIIGSVLVLLGVMCRDSCAKMLLPFATWLAVFFIRSTWLKSFHHELIVKNVIKNSSVVLISIVVLIVSERVFLNNNPLWQSYWKYENANALVIDRGMHLSYDHDSEAYARIETDENDLKLYSAWQFGDIDFYSVDWLTQVKNIESKYNDRSLRINKEVLTMPFTMILDTVFGNGGSSRWLIISALGATFLISFIGKTIDKIYALGNVVGIYGVYWYFSCINRFMWRVECGIFVAVLLFAMIYIKYSVDCKIDGSLKMTIIHEKTISMLALIATAVILSICCAINVYNWRYVKDKCIVEREADITGRLENFVASEDNFYILTDFYVTNNPMSITKAKYENLYENSAYAGNWTFPSPVMMQSLQNRGYSNPMRALVDNDVYLHATNQKIAEMIRKHLQKVLNKELTLSEIDKELYSIR